MITILAARFLTPRYMQDDPSRWWYLAAAETLAEALLIAVAIAA